MEHESKDMRAFGAFFELRQALSICHPHLPPPHQCIIDSPVLTPYIVTWATLAKVRRLDGGVLEGVE